MPLADFLNQQATITAESSPGTVPPQTTMGGPVRLDRLTVADGVPCKVRVRSSTLSGSSTRNAKANVVVATIYFNYDPVPEGLSTRHWIEVDGENYKVTGVINPNSMDDIYQANCEAIRK